MKKSILDLDGANLLTKKEKKSINGGAQLEVPRGCTNIYVPQGDGTCLQTGGLVGTIQFHDGQFYCCVPV